MDNPLWAVFAQNLHGIGVRLAVMNDDWQTKIARKTRLRFKNRALYIARREIIMVIKPNFSDCDNLINAAEFGKLCKVALLKSVRLVRMDAHSAVQPRPARCKLYSLYTRRKIARSVDHAADAFFGQTVKQRAAVIVEFMVVVMRVGIKNILIHIPVPFHLDIDPRRSRQTKFAGCAAG